MFNVFTTCIYSVLEIIILNQISAITFKRNKYMFNQPCVIIYIWQKALKLNKKINSLHDKYRLPI